MAWLISWGLALDSLCISSLSVQRAMFQWRSMPTCVCMCTPSAFPAPTKLTGRWALKDLCALRPPQNMHSPFQCLLYFPSLPCSLSGKQWSNILWLSGTNRACCARLCGHQQTGRRASRAHGRQHSRILLGLHSSGATAKQLLVPSQAWYQGLKLSVKQTMSM